MLKKQNPDQRHDGHLRLLTRCAVQSSSQTPPGSCFAPASLRRTRCAVSGLRLLSDGERPDQRRAAGWRQRVNHTGDTAAGALWGNTVSRPRSSSLRRVPARFLSGFFTPFESVRRSKWGHNLSH